MRQRLRATESSSEARQRARTALARGERAEEPSEPFEPGPDPALACQHYREAVRWALAALAGAAPWPELWQAADEHLLLRAAGSAARLDAIRSWLLQPSFEQDVRSASAEPEHMARELRGFAAALVAAIDADETALRRLRAQRRRRVSLCLALLAVIVLRVSSWLRDVELRTDLARGKPWRASSSALHCDPEQRRCEDYLGTTIFFHTENEPSPWLEIDLEQPQQISEVRVRNRTDCCSERAVPLVVELSSDDRTWHEVARRERNFRTWRARFAPTAARWVRLRVDATSMLHLERVSVYR